MFCHRCGVQIQAGQPFCSGCGESVMGVGQPPRLMQSRVCGHLRNLGILWIVYSALRLLPLGIFHWMFRSGYFDFGPWGNNWGGWGPFHLFGLLSGIWALSAIGGVIAGWGLLSHQPWARMLALILGCISLVHPLLGTLLGIYTLWVLLPSESEAEYRRVAQV